MLDAVFYLFGSRLYLAGCVSTQSENDLLVDILMQSQLVLKNDLIIFDRGNNVV